jgi:hypothetical protein
MGEKLSPLLTDKYMERSTFDSQKTEIDAPADRPSNLYEPHPHDGGERGQFQGRVKKWSVYTETALHPRTAMGLVAGVGLAVAAGIRKLRGRKAIGTEADSRRP